MRMRFPHPSSRGRTRLLQLLLGLTPGWLGSPGRDPCTYPSPLAGASSRRRLVFWLMSCCPLRLVFKLLTLHPVSSSQQKAALPFPAPKALPGCILPSQTRQSQQQWLHCRLPQPPPWLAAASPGGCSTVLPRVLPPVSLLGSPTANSPSPSPVSTGHPSVPPQPPRPPFRKPYPSPSG